MVCWSPLSLSRRICRPRPSSISKISFGGLAYLPKWVLHMLSQGMLHSTPSLNCLQPVVFILSVNVVLDKRAGLSQYRTDLCTEFNPIIASSSFGVWSNTLNSASNALLDSYGFEVSWVVAIWQWFAMAADFPDIFRRVCYSRPSSVYQACWLVYPESTSHNHSSAWSELRNCVAASRCLG